MYKWIVFFGLCMYMVVSCTTQRPVPQPQFSNLYNSKAQKIEADYKVYHYSIDSSAIYFSLNTRELLYTRYNNDVFLGKFRMGYQLIDPQNNKIVDSTSKVFKDKKSESDEHLIQGVLRFRMIQDRPLDMVVFIQDLNRPAQSVAYKEFDRSNPKNGQNYLLRESSGRVISGNIINTADSIKIESQLSSSDRLYIRYLNIGNELPPPPFSRSKSPDYTPEINTLDTINFGGSNKLTFPHDGLFLIGDDTSRQRAFTLLKFSNSFPRVKSADLFYKPLRYLTSTNEYAAIDSSDNPKEAAEAFWIKSAGSKDLARNAIQKYYQRVEEANENFTTYNEGWATDRGLILIIFGPPERVTKQFKREFWYYGQESTGATLTFSFVKVNHPFSDNVYELDRSPGYKSHWYRALDSWRAGRPYYAR